MSACKSCGASVLWAKLLPRDKLAPLDVEPSTTGNIRMLGERKAVARVLGKEELAAARAAGELLYTSHFATCVNAQQHRRAR